MNPTDRYSTHELLAKATESSAIGAWCRDTESNDVWYSQEWKTMLGYKDSEIENQYAEWRNRVHPDDRIYVDDCIRDYLMGKTPFYQCDYRLCTKAGGYLKIRAKGRRIPNTSFIIGTHEDLSRSHDRETLYRTVLDALDILVFVKERRETGDSRLLTFPFLYANEAVAEGYGHTTENIIGKVDSQLNNDTRQVRHFAEWDERAFQEGLARLPAEDVTLIWGGNKETIKVATTKRRLSLKDAFGQARDCVLGWGVPVDDLGGIDYEELTAFLDAVPDPMFMKGLDHKFRRANRAAVALAEKKSEAELIGKDESIFPWVDSINYAAAAAETETRIRSHRQPEESRRKVTHNETGVVSERLVKKAPVIGKDGNVLGYVGIVRDVTDFQNRLSEQWLTDCTLLLSHGTRRRLGHIYSELSELHGLVDTEEGQARCARMRNELDVLGARSENALEILEALSQQPPIQLENVNMGKAIEHLLHTLTSDCFHFSIPDRACYAHTHERYIVSGIEELLFNAKDALDRQHDGRDGRLPAVEIWIEEVSEHDSMVVEVHIRDNGPGLGFSIREHNPPQDGRDDNRNEGGRGRGLFSVYRMLERINGTLSTVEGDTGTHLKIKLPQAKA